MKQDTLNKLLTAAEKQETWQKKQLLPKFLHRPARWLGAYPWQIISLAAFISALLAIYWQIEIHLL